MADRLVKPAQCVGAERREVLFGAAAKKRLLAGLGLVARDPKDATFSFSYSTPGERDRGEGLAHIHG